MALKPQPSIQINLDAFPEALTRATEGLALGLTELGFAIEQQAKYNIVSQDAVDTGALMNSVYTQSDLHDGRDEAIALATAAAGLPGKHSRKPHDEPFEGAEEEHTATGLQCKVGVAAEYGIYVEYGTERMAGRPFLNTAVQSVRPKANRVIEKRMIEALGE